MQLTVLRYFANRLKLDPDDSSIDDVLCLQNLISMGVLQTNATVVDSRKHWDSLSNCRYCQVKEKCLVYLANYKESE